jgi:hypothetical protein
VKRFADAAARAGQPCDMSMTRRGLAATLMPMLALGAALRPAAAKTAGPPADACRPGDPGKRCAAAKAHFVADAGEDDGGCPFCARPADGKAAAPDLARKGGAG